MTAYIPPSWSSVTDWQRIVANAVNPLLQAGIGGGGGGSLTDGDYGDITVGGTGTTLTIDSGAVSLAKMANVATGTVFYRKTAGAGSPEVQTLATLKTDLGLTGTNSGDQTITLSGDVSGSGTGAITTTLATVNANVGSFGSATKSLSVTVNGKGLITALSEQTVTPAWGSITETPTTRAGYGITDAAASGAVTSSGLTMTTARVLGRTTASTGAIEEITVGTGLSLAGGSLVATGAASGGGSAPWVLVDQTGVATAGSTTWTFSTNVAQVDVTGLSGYNELLIFVRNVTTSVSGNRAILASVDNGSTFFTTSGDYVGVSTLGVESNNTIWAAHGTASTAARSLLVHVTNLKGVIKNAFSMIGGNSLMFVGSSSDVNAIRLNNVGGGNLTGGALYVFAR